MQRSTAFTLYSWEISSLDWIVDCNLHHSNFRFSIDDFIILIKSPDRVAAPSLPEFLLSRPYKY